MGAMMITGDHQCVEEEEEAEEEWGDPCHLPWSTTMITTTTMTRALTTTVDTLLNREAAGAVVP